MSDETLLDFATVQANLTAENVKAHGAELHGVLTGLICAGYAFENTDYLAMINDLFNSGEGLPLVVKSMVKQLYSEIWQTLLDDSYGFKLMLADDDDSMAERANAIGSWVQGFNLGFGLQQKDTAIASEDVKEVISDFAEIANLSDEIEEDEATEQAYYEIAEYVKVSALLCFSEQGTPPETKKEETIH
jgi:uncharacterized protein